jgi:predicted porin
LSRQTRVEECGARHGKQTETVCKTSTDAQSSRGESEAKMRTTRQVGQFMAVILAASFAPGLSFASDELDVYGRINVTLQDSDEADVEQAELQSNSSRIGVKGKKALSTSLKVIYQLEWGVNIDSDGNDDNLVPRNQFVGLEGAWGTIKVGRHDTALKQSQDSFDLFDDLEGDITKTFNGENRLKNYVGYITPVFGKAFSATVNIFPGEDPGTGNHGVADKSSVSLEYDSDLLYIAVAHDSDIDGDGVTTNRVVGGHTFGPARLMFLYQQTDNGTVNEDGYGVSLAWTFGKNVAKVQYLAADIWRTQLHADPLDNKLQSQLSIGLDRRLAESTRVFFFYTTGEIGGTHQTNNYVAVGIEHKF